MKIRIFSPKGYFDIDTSKIKDWHKIDDWEKCGSAPDAIWIDEMVKEDK